MTARHAVPLLGIKAYTIKKKIKKKIFTIHLVGLGVDSKFHSK